MTLTPQPVRQPAFVARRAGLVTAAALVAALLLAGCDDADEGAPAPVATATPSAVVATATPEPTPTATPEPTPTATPEPTPTATPEPTPTATPEPTPTATPEPTPTATPEPTPTATPEPTPTATPEPTPTATPEPTPTATPEPTPTATPDPTPTATPDPTPTPEATPEGPRIVPEYEVVGLGRWFNSEPFTIQEQLEAGNVVLIDFWTYSCINCVRTLPFLRSWHEKYADRGLVILGVHRPEFAFERSAENVAAAIERLDVPWPVAQDNDSRTWRTFNNRWWPAKFLFDKTGEVVYDHIGEGRYDETERAIRKALTEAGHDVSDIPVGTVSNSPTQSGGTKTKEMWAGTRRNYGSFISAAQDEYFLGANRVVDYEDETAPEDREHNKWYVQGLWRNEQEAMVHARETENLEDYFVFIFRARSVNVVISPPEPEPFDVYIEIDGRWLEPEEAGPDIEFDDEGRSFIRVSEPRHYEIVQLPTFGQHELKLASNSDNFAIFALTFGRYLEGA